MSIYAISDLHLSFGVAGKPMDIFGKQWENHAEKIATHWKKTIHEDDVVLMAGDFSWATYLEESLADFRFLEQLPGKKILLKGNHDYWWTTMKKMQEFLTQNEIHTVMFLYHNAIELENYVIAGTRYWAPEEEMENDKIFHRECERAKLSLQAVQQLNTQKPIIFMTHYPPDERIIQCVQGYPIQHWIYGHIHSNYEESIVNISPIHTYLTSCDYLNFQPLLIP